VVWFGEEVPKMPEAARLTENADIFVVIGTSMNVYPAAGLINHVPMFAPVYVIDPNDVSVFQTRKVEVIRQKATKGVVILAGKLLEDHVKA
jgi:NAD-dependent deacetylase